MNKALRTKAITAFFIIYIFWKVNILLNVLVGNPTLGSLLVLVKKG